MWQLKINIEKCILVHMGSSNYKFHYSLNGAQLKSTSHVRDLGVEIDSSLKFDHHLNNIVTRAYQRINLLFRGFVTKDAVFLKKCFITYVRPILEYCSPTWSPYLLCDIDKLERVQKYFTRRISGLKEYSYSERLFILNLESLELRRLYSDLKMYFLITHKLIDLDYSDFFTVIPGKVTTRGHNFKIVLKKCRLDLSKYSFSNRCVNCWNSLSSGVVNSSSVNIFMTKLKKCDLRDYLMGRTLGI